MTPGIKRMRLLHIMASTALGGAETYSTDVMLSLHREGVDQCVVLSKNAPRFHELQEAGIRLAPWVLAVPFLPLQRLFTGLLIAREKPDIVHCWNGRIERRVIDVLPVETAGIQNDWSTVQQICRVRRFIQRKKKGEWQPVKEENVSLNTSLSENDKNHAIRLDS